MGNDPPLYRTSDVARASSMPQRTLERLLDRGAIALSARDIAAAGHGRFRYFTNATTRKVALTNWLMRLGVPPTPAGAIAERFNHRTGLLVLDEFGNASVHQSQADFHLNRGAILLDLGQIALDVDERLVLLCHKFWCPFRAAQHGQRESVVARAATNLRRIVAIEFGTWRSGRNGGSSGLVTFA